MNFGICAAEERSGWIVDRDFYQQCARDLIDGVRGAYKSSRKTPTGKFCQHEISCQTRFGSLRVNLRNVDVNAQLIRLRNMEEFRARAAAAAGIDQRANIGTASGNYATEWRIYLFE